MRQSDLKETEIIWDVWRNLLEPLHLVVVGGRLPKIVSPGRSNMYSCHPYIPQHEPAPCDGVQAKETPVGVSGHGGTSSSCQHHSFMHPLAQPGYKLSV